MARQGGETMSECKLFSHIILGALVHRHSAGAVRSSWRGARVMTMSGRRATTRPHGEKKERERERNATSDPPRHEREDLVFLSIRRDHPWICKMTLTFNQ